MSFRARLTLFFAIIVVIPMAAVALVLFSLTAKSENGKADARLAAGMRSALALYDSRVEAARPALRKLVRDPGVSRALLRGDAGAFRRTARRVVGRTAGIDAILLYDRSGRVSASLGDPDAVAYATAVAESRAGDRGGGTVAVSVTSGAGYVRAVGRLTGLAARVLRGDRLVASTLGERSGAAATGERRVTIAGRRYRGRVQPVQRSLGQPIAVGVYTNATPVSSAISKSRLLIGLILLAFLVLALVTSVFVVRALQGQIARFLDAARRLGRGDFSQPVPVEGDDEFAALGSEFNRMSGELEGHIQELERHRRELEEAIRRVGEAFAAGLDREGAVELAVRTAVDACDAEAGRTIAIDARKIERAEIGMQGGGLAGALEAAERAAFAIRPSIGRELLAAFKLEGDGADASQLDLRAVTAEERDGVHALAMPMRARVGAGREVDTVGVVSIARRGRPFTERESDVFAYLVTQAAVSIENVDLHETLSRQAVTDELTGLFNVRRFHERLDAEIERGARFETPLALVMLDIDDFKQVNDAHGHQQGDLVLIEVARVLRRLSREVDAPARYGGEEMAVILPQTDAEGARQQAERLREGIEAVELPRLDGRGPLRITASFGVASIPGEARDKGSLIASADAALYRSKRAGKNRVERAEPLVATG